MAPIERTNDVTSSLIDLSVSPTGYGIGNWTRLSDLTSALARRVVRAAARDHSADPLARDLGSNPLERLYYLRNERMYPRPACLPWNAVRIVGVIDSDPACPDDLLAVVVRYGHIALACYSIGRNGEPRCYWN